MPTLGQLSDSSKDKEWRKLQFGSGPRSAKTSVFGCFSCKGSVVQYMIVAVLRSLHVLRPEVLPRRHSGSSAVAKPSFEQLRDVDQNGHRLSREPAVVMENPLGVI